jgi:tetratricopeptide (TPR) repeat protein
MRRAEVKPFVLETFVRDLMGIPSGVIGLRKRGQALEIYVMDGQVIHQKSPSAFLHLGSVLTRKKLCDETTIQDALQCQSATGFPFGECLVKKAYLTREQLLASLREQVLQTAEAMAHFLPAEEILLELDLKKDSWEPLGVGRLDLLQAFVRALPRWPADPPLCVNPQTEVLAVPDPQTFASFPMTSSQYYLLNQARTPIPWKTIYSMVPGNQFEKEKDAFYLCAGEAIRVLKEAKRLDPFEEAVAFAKQAPGLNLFEILSVQAASSDDQVRAAYFELAKRFHPDKFSRYSEFPKNRAMLENLFATINQAYQILHDPAERMKYIREQEAGKPKAVDLNQKARELLGEVRNAMAQKQYTLAVQRINEIIYLKKADARTYLMLGICLLKGEEKSREAEAALKKCLELDPQEADAHYHLGLLYAKGRLKARAVKSFQKALELNPSHLDAAQWLKDFENA